METPEPGTLQRLVQAGALRVAFPFLGELFVLIATLMSHQCNFLLCIGRVLLFLSVAFLSLVKQLFYIKLSQLK